MIHIHLHQLQRRLNLCEDDAAHAREVRYLELSNTTGWGDERLTRGLFILLGTNILLMVQKSGNHQLRLLVYPIIHKILYIPGGCLGFLNCQQYLGNV